jgi:hypothetical protein
MHRPRLLPPWRLRGPLRTGTLAVLVPALLVAGALAAWAGISARPATQLRLVADTPAGCNAPQPAGFMSCDAIIRTPADHQITPDQSGPPSTALTPADLQSAYDLPSATAGGGQTVTIVDAGDDPTAESDLAVFRSHYGLPPCTTANGCFTKVNQVGEASPLPPVVSGWPTEESLDLDTVSAICPNCNIRLIEADDASNTNLIIAEVRAFAMGAKFISNSFSGPEYPGEYWPYEAGTAVTVSAGDYGYQDGFPATSPDVTAVGGTTLAKDSSVPRGWDETVWGNGAEGEDGDGTGSGCSAYEPQPSFQQDIPQLDAVCTKRAFADVSADANPASGLAIYDTTGEGGWLQVGGTSLASPLIAATYALAGTPAAGTDPNSYPYHDKNQSSDLNDITQGSNGNCGNVLCNAGKGWDGPTGLGTPHGVKAFESSPQGTISGRVTSASTGDPVSGVAIAAEPGNYATRTGANGDYELSVAAGTYTSLAATEYGYHPGTDSGIAVTAGHTTTENFALTAEPSGTLSGTVTDGSGEGWPLHAKVTVPGDPDSPFWTSPYTGAYRITLPQGSYSLGISTDYPGYKSATVQVTVGAATTQDFTLDANLAACTAPGYGPDGLTESFTGWSGGTPQDGWTVTSPGGAGWRFDNPGNRPPPPSESVSTWPGTGYREFIEFDSDDFAVADAGYYSPRALHTTLTSPPADLAGQTGPDVSFDSAWYPGTPAGSGPAPLRPAASVQLSTDGGRTWATVWHQTAGNVLGPVNIDIPQAAGKTSVRARWVFTGGGLGYWAVDDVHIGSPGCTPQKGGLLAGIVTDEATGSPINGASITSAAVPGPLPWPEGISLASSDPALPGGFYWLFLPSGSQQVKAGAAGYATAGAAVNVKTGRLTQRNWQLSNSGGG